MPGHLVIGGRIVKTVPEVLDAYQPTITRISAAQWARTRALVVAAVEGAHYPSIHGAHLALRVVSAFVAWAEDEGVELHAERLFQPDRVERYIGVRRSAATRRTRANERAVLRRVGRTATTTAPWPAEPQPFQGHVHLKAPYSTDEVKAFWRAVDHQATDHRRRVLRAMLLLGLGAGLKPREVLECTASQVKSERASGLTAVFLSDRTVPVINTYAEGLRGLCREFPEGPLVGHWNRNRRDPFTGLRRGIEIPGHLPTLTAPRLRTTWMATVLQHDLRISEFMVIAGTVSSKSLECIAPYVPGRWDNDEYLHRAAGR